MNDPWQADYSSAMRLAQKVYEAVEERNRQERISAQYGRSDNEASKGLRQYSAAVSNMRNIQLKNSQSFHLTQREIDRRQGMLEELQTKEKQLEQMISGSSSFGGIGQGTSGTNPWADDEESGANYMDTHQIRQHQQNLVREQDEGIDILNEVLQRQKNLAVDIGNEIDRQDGIIEDIKTNTEVTDARVREETDHVRRITLKENRGNCAMWVAIVLLFVAIIVILCIPTK